jgi:Uma2 family endonuclease
MGTFLLKQSVGFKPTTFLKPPTKRHRDYFYTETDTANKPVVKEWDYEKIITEDDTPVDNFPSAKQQRLLVDSLYNSWTPSPDSPFLTDANIGVFYDPKKPGIVPDVFLSLGVFVAKDWWKKKNRSYFLSVFGKPPDVVIEIVSNKEGNEDGTKLDIYATIKIPYYVIYDPDKQLEGGELRVYQLNGYSYFCRDDYLMPKLGLSLTLWTGRYEKQEQTWLRWCDKSGDIILTGGERAEKERIEKENALNQLEQERFEKEQALTQVKQLMAKLQALGISPSDI